MPSKKCTINGVTLEVWEKSFRVTHLSSGFVGPVHFIDDDLETAMDKVVGLVRHIRECQHTIDTKALERALNDASTRNLPNNGDETDSN